MTQIISEITGFLMMRLNFLHWLKHEQSLKLDKACLLIYCPHLTELHHYMTLRERERERENENVFFFY